MKLTKRKYNRKMRKTRKHKFRFVLKGGQYIDEENPEELLLMFEKTPEIDISSYYCSEGSYMKIKTDVTKVIHRLPQIREGCVAISKELQSFIFERWTPMLEYIFSQFDVSIIDTIMSQEDTTELKQIFVSIKSELAHPELSRLDKTHPDSIREYYYLFTQHLYSKNITKFRISKFANAFYRFYLKGGSAMLFIINEYHKSMKSEEYKMTPEEIEDVLGGYSDYDFNFTINPMLPRERNNPHHHNMLRELSKKYIFEILKTLVYSDTGHMFRNDELVETIAKHLSEHKPALIIDQSNSPKNIGIYMKEKTENDRKNNRFAEITASNIIIEHVFREERNYRDNKFDLVRLLASFRNITKPSECENNKQYKHYINGELIDVSIPHFDSHEVFKKWEESKSITMINDINVYNLSAIIHDLEQVVEENIKRQDPKLAKRERRLTFFNKLACVLPTMIHDKYADSKINITNACEQLFNEIIITDSSLLTPENKKSLTITLIGIYDTYPEFIRFPTIFLLLKQYLTHRINIPTDTTRKLYELSSPFIKQNQFPHLEYDESAQYDQSYYKLLTVADNKITSSIDIQPHIYKYAIHLINMIQHIHDTVSSDQMKYNIKQGLSILLIEFNNIYISLNDNTMVPESISAFIQSLNDLLINLQLYNINENYSEYLTGQNIFISKEKLHNQQLKKNEYTRDFMKKNYGALILQSLLLTEEIKQAKNIQSRLVLKGGFLYDIYKSIQNAILKNETDFSITTNDMDMFMFVNQPYLKDEDIDFIYRSFIQLKTYFEATRDPLRPQRICIDKRRQNENVYLIHMTVYDYVPYTKFQTEVFTTILEKIYPTGMPTNLYRIVESHTYELYIMNIPKSSDTIVVNDYYSYPKPKYTLHNFVPDIGSSKPKIVNLWEAFIQNFERHIKSKIPLMTVPAEYRSLTINLRTLYVDSLIDIKKSYDGILTSYNDALRKDKYMNRMLGYT